MSKKRNSPRQGLGIYPLWLWGLIVIVAGVAANVVMSNLQLFPEGSDAARGEAFGAGVTVLLAIIAGVVLIIMHFVRRKR